MKDNRFSFFVIIARPHSWGASRIHPLNSVRSGSGERYSPEPPF